MSHWQYIWLKKGILSEIIDVYENKFPPLIIASCCNQIKTVATILGKCPPEKLFDLLTMTADGNVTALHLAAEVGYTEVVRLILGKCPPEKLFDLLKKQAEADATALHLAAHEGHKEVVRLILEKRPSGNLIKLLRMTANGNVTALHMAAQDNREEVVRVILEIIQGKCPPEKLFDLLAMAAKGNVTALHLAAQNGHKEVVRLILGKCPPGSLVKLLTIKNNDDETALYRALNCKKKEAAQTILNFLNESKNLKKEDVIAVVNAKDQQWVTAFMVGFMIGKENAQMCLDFLKKCSDEVLLSVLNVTSDEGWTVLGIAHDVSDGLLLSLLEECTRLKQYKFSSFIKTQIKIAGVGFFLKEVMGTIIDNKKKYNKSIKECNEKLEKITDEKQREVIQNLIKAITNKLKRLEKLYNYVNQALLGYAVESLNTIKSSNEKLELLDEKLK